MTPRSLRLTHAGGATESTGPGRLVCPQQHRTRALVFLHGGLGVQPRPTAVTSLGLPRRVPLNTNKQHLFSTISPPPFWTSLSFPSPALPTAPQPSSPPPAPSWRLSIQHAITLLQQQNPAAISSFLALSTFHLAPSTRSQYAISLANFLQWLPPNFAAASDILFALQHYLLRLSSPPRAGAARSVLAAITFAAHTVLPNLVVPRVLLAHYHCHRAACASSAAVMVSRQLFVCGRPSFHFPTRCFPLVRHYPHLLHLFASHLRGLLHHGFRYQKRPLRNSRSQT